MSRFNLDLTIIRSMVHIPLISIFNPFLSIPNTLSRLTGPPISFLNKYYTSFTDGTQQRFFARLASEFQAGGALKVLARTREHMLNRMEVVAKLVEEREDARNKQKEVATSDGQNGRKGWQKDWEIASQLVEKHKRDEKDEVGGKDVDATKRE